MAAFWPPPSFWGLFLTGYTFHWLRHAMKTENTCQAGSPEELQADAELDLRGVICPYNFVKTKLKLETMKAGQVLAVILDEGDPIRNVPRSVSDDGHQILRQDSLVAHAYRVMIRKRADA